MWYLLDFRSRTFRDFQFPEEVIRILKKEQKEGMDENFEVIHASEMEQLSAQEFLSRWDSEDSEPPAEVACDAETCLFNPRGVCLAPVVTGHPPQITEDGCDDWREKEEDR